MNRADIVKAIDYIVRCSCENTSTGNYIVGVEDVASAIGVNPENVFNCREEIMDKMCARDEVLEVVFDYDYNYNGAFDGIYALAYCPNYEWDNDEETFGCTYEEWMENLVEPIVDAPLV